MSEIIKKILSDKGLNDLYYNGHNEYANGYYIVIVTKTSIIIKQKIGYSIPEIINIA